MEIFRIKKLAGLFSKLVLILFCMTTVADAASLPYKERVKNFELVKRYTDSGPAYKTVLTHEGQFVNSFNEDMDAFLKAPLDKKWLSEVFSLLEEKKTLEIGLTKEGFAQAADRATDGKEDATHYDAIWVRDSVWIYFSFVETQQYDKAQILLGNLTRYYLSSPQQKRFRAIMVNPSLKTDPMAVPHIRFDGKSEDLRDVYIDGKPQVWNHKQLDAHGLFFEAFLDGMERGYLEGKKVKGLAKTLIQYFEAVEFWNYEESGAWEELDRKNSSSIAIVARSIFRLKAMQKQFFPDLGFSISQLEGLYLKGLATVRKQVNLGGESPDYRDQRSPQFRKADAALMNLLLPYPLPGLNESELRKVVLTIETLKRESGILRYTLDSYQSGNYWIVDPSQDRGHQGEIEATAITSEGFLKRLSGFLPQSEAQWFFDSKLAWMKLVLAEMTSDDRQRQIDIYEAKVALKRSIAQITGNRDQRQLITADGHPVEPFLLPESINTVIIADKEHFLPSPITPLNWAKAGLTIALKKMENTL